MKRRHRLRTLPSVSLVESPKRRRYRRLSFLFGKKVIKTSAVISPSKRRVHLSPLRLQAITVPPKPPKSRLSTFFKSPISLSGCKKKKARDNRARRVSFFKSGAGGSRPPHKRNYNKEC